MLLWFIYMIIDFFTNGLSTENSLRSQPTHMHVEDP